MHELEKDEENKKIIEWAHMSDREFYLRYFQDATEEELADFYRRFPEFRPDED